MVSLFLCICFGVLSTATPSATADEAIGSGRGMRPDPAALARLRIVIYVNGRNMRGVFHKGRTGR